MTRSNTPSTEGKTLTERVDANVAVKAARLGIWEMDPTTNLINWDDRCRELFGLTENQAISYEEMIRHIHPDDQVRVDQSVQWAINPKSGGEYDVEFRTVGLDGGILRWVRFMGQSYFDQAGKAFRFAGVAQNVTKDQHTQQQLAASNERFRSLLEEAPIATCLFVGRELIIDIVNELMLQFWGKSNVVMGKPLAQAVPELAGQPFLRILDEVYTTGKPYHATNDRADLVIDGQLTTHYFNLIYKPLFDEKGHVYAIMNMSVDVTQQVMARKVIEASEAKLRSVIATAPAAMGLFVGRDLVVEMPNKAFIDIVGKGPDIAGKPLREVMPELDNQPFLQILDDVYTSGKMFQSFGTQVNIVQQGVMTHNFYNITYSPLLDDDGQVYAILDIAIDVTERVVVEQQIEESRRQLLASFEQSPVAIAIIGDPDLTFRMANPFYGELVGRTPDELVGKPLLEALPELREQGFDQLLRDVIATGVPFVAKEIAVDIVRQNQLETIYIDLTYQPQREADTGTVSGVLVVAVDVSQQVVARQKIEESERQFRALSIELDQEVQERTKELMATNEELAATNEELTESNELLIRSNENLQQFAYIASHDLQEPLRKVQQFGDLLKNRYAVGLGEGVDYLERMQVAASRMSSLIKDLLSFSRISTQRDTNKSVSLTQVVQTVVDELDLVIEETGALVTINPLPTLLGDSPQLAQLFQNLLSNALKFRREGISPVISVSSQVVNATRLPSSLKPTRAARDYHRIDVTDNGIGFDTKYVDRIFQVFQRLHGKNEFAGTGVGLAICEKVVANHGGAITAASQPGQGATFSVYLPVVKEYVSL